MLRTEEFLNVLMTEMETVHNRVIFSIHGSDRHFPNIVFGFCARLCEADVNIKVIQSIMGHKDIQIIIDIYAEATEDKKKNSIEQVFNQIKIF